MKNLFILELTYQKDLSQVEKFLPPHNQYLQKTMIQVILSALDVKILEQEESY